MKRTFFILVFLALIVPVNAQMAKWLIQPCYDNIDIQKGIEAIVTDSSGVKSIWTMSGQRLITTDNVINPFKENLSVLTKMDEHRIIGICDEKGVVTTIDSCYVTHDYPYYSDGKLLVKQGVYYHYMDTQGKIDAMKYTEAYPYSNGYAVCKTFLNFEKQKDLRITLLDVKGDAVDFVFNDKTFDSDDIDFVSSVNDEGVGFVVLKRKVYIFDGKSKTLSPLCPTDDGDNQKEQAKLDGDIEASLKKENDSIFVLTAKCGKSVNVEVRFDFRLRPVSLMRNDMKKMYADKKETKKEYASPLKLKNEDNLIGVYWDGMEILPPQFQEVKTCFDNRALVKLNGKYGMLEFYKDKSFKIKMNKGDDIAFRHQKFETTVRVDIPIIISSDDTSLEIDSKTGCDLDKTSKETKNTDSGNYVQYNCVLNIPDSLPDSLTDILYPVQVLYNGLKSPVIPFKVKAWHYKYFVVDVDDSQTTLENGTVSFVFNINAERIASDGVYPTTVNIYADSLQYELEKMSETRYKCKVLALNEGVNNIVVNVLEQGCPPAAFPFEVEYHKPVAKTRNKPAEKERVAIKKKPKNQQAKPSAPFVIM